MDIQEILESMAINVADSHDEEIEPSDEMVKKWQRLFGYSADEAVKYIKEQKGDLCRHRVSDDHWDLVRSTQEAEGFDRDTYEYRLKITVGPEFNRNTDSNLVSRPDDIYIIKLGGVLCTPDKVKEIAQLPDTPRANRGVSETGDAVFCRITGATKQTIERWLSKYHPTFESTFVLLNFARKDLSPDSIYPTLGREATLPHHRKCHLEPRFNIVLQNQYPVWYFFYGTLADTARLSRLQSLPASETPVLFPANISGGLIKSWQGRYNALVDGAETDVVHGSAYEVTSEEREDSLRQYETHFYEVVRCTINMADQTVQGLTFRLIERQ